MSTRRLYSQIFGGRILGGGGYVEREVQVRTPTAAHIAEKRYVSGQQLSQLDTAASKNRQSAAPTFNQKRNLPGQQPAQLSKAASWKKQNRSPPVVVPKAKQQRKAFSGAACLSLVKTYFADVSGGQAESRCVPGVADLVRSWNDGRGALLPETLANLDIVAWSDSWTNPEYHAFLTSIVCNQPHRFQVLARAIVHEPRVALENRTTAVRLFNSIFTEIGTRDLNMVDSWLSEFALYRQLCPPEMWTLDFLDGCKLNTRLARKYVQYLSFGPPNWRLRALSAFLRGQHIPEKAALQLDYLLACAASGALFTQVEVKHEVKRVTLGTDLGTQKLCCLAWIASNNGYDSVLKDCVKLINSAKFQSKRKPLRDREVASLADAVACCLQLGKVHLLQEAIVILVHSVEPFGSPSRAGAVLGNVFVDQARLRNVTAKLLPTLCLALEPAQVVELLDAFLSTVEESGELTKVQLKNVTTAFLNFFALA